MPLTALGSVAPSIVTLKPSILTMVLPQGVQKGVWDFVVRRLEQLLVDEGLRVEAVRAVLSQRGNDPALAAASARAAHEQLQAGPDAPLARVLAAMARPVRIMRGKDMDADVQVSRCVTTVAYKVVFHASMPTIPTLVGGPGAV